MATATVTFRQLLAGINAYPIPPLALNGIGAARGLDLDATASTEGIKGSSYRLARADTLMWLADAPNIAQGGQNYSFSEDQRDRFRNEAQAVYDELEPDTKRTQYGYKGSRL